MLLSITGLTIVTTVTASSAHADECYTWSRNLGSGTSGSDAAQLQIRVAGWAGYGVNMAIDGDFGAQTAAAVTGFQRAYGLVADGVAGPATYSKVYALQDPAARRSTSPTPRPATTAAVAPTPAAQRRSPRSTRTSSG